MSTAVGGMTELDLEVELDLCGKEVILIVAKAKSSARNKILQRQEQRQCDGAWRRLSRHW